MWLHYHKHEQNYLNQLNRLLEKFHYDYCYGLEELLYHIQEFPVSSQENLLFYLGGVLNHNLYWMGMSTKRKGPQGKLKIQLEKTFGSYDGFWKIFKEKALQMKGSGYTFLVLNRDG